jgi:hypothetical protein
MPVVQLHDEHSFPTVVIVSGTLVPFVHVVLLSVARTLSGGSQSLYCRSPRSMVTLYWAIVVHSHGTFSNSTASLPVDPVTTAPCSSSHDRQPCSSTWSLVHSPRLPRSLVEVLRFVNFHEIDLVTALLLSSLNIQACSLPIINISVALIDTLQYE